MPSPARPPCALPEVTGCIEPQSRASIVAVLRLALSICHCCGLGLQQLGLWAYGCMEAENTVTPTHLPLRTRGALSSSQLC